MQGDHVGVGKQSAQIAHGNGIAEGELVLDVVVAHAHAHRFGQDAQLGSDVTVADDAQRLSPDLEGVVGRFHPHTPMRSGVLLRQTPHEEDDLGQHEFRDAPGVRERSVEDGDAPPFGARKIDLVGADAEAPHRNEFLRCREDFFGDLSP